MTCKSDLLRATSGLRRPRCQTFLLMSLFFLNVVGVVRVAAQSDLAILSSQGQAALRDQQFDRAVQLYEQITKLDSRSAQAHSNLGLALYMSAKYPRAIQEFQKALQLIPPFANPKFHSR